MLGDLGEAEDVSAEVAESALIAERRQVYRDAKGEHRWRLLSAGNNETIADSGEGYSSLSKCEDGIELVKQQAPGAETAYDKSVGAVKLNK